MTTPRYDTEGSLTIRKRGGPPLKREKCRTTAHEITVAPPNERVDLAAPKRPRLGGGDER